MLKAHFSQKIKIIFLLFFVFRFSGEVFSQDQNKIALAKQYLNKGEIEKAFILYKKLAKDPVNISQIHSSYLQLLFDQKKYKASKNYLKRLTKKFPKDLEYKLDLLRLSLIQKKSDEKQVLKKLIREHQKNQYQLRKIGNYLVKNKYHALAEFVFLESTKGIKNKNAFTYDLSNLFQITNQKDKLVDLYLRTLAKSSISLSYVKSVLGRSLSEDGDYDALEKKLIRSLQKEPNTNYTELLIWTYLQQKDFYSAFIQTKALERRLKGSGKRIYAVGEIALNNQNYDEAIEIFTYITVKYSDSDFYTAARKNGILAKFENIKKNSLNIDSLKIRELIKDYRDLYKELGDQKDAIEGLVNKASLHAFYLNEYDSAIIDLKFILEKPRVPLKLQMEAKLNLGDIYLFKEEPWESVLLYAQVEKQMKDSPIGYEAKLKNAKLSYYKGDFILAKEHLDVLKQATTRKIANDAMELSLLIKDNSGLDSTEKALKSYSKIDLFLAKNKTKEALDSVNSMLEIYKNHSLVDELLWKRAKIYQSVGNYEAAILDLQKIITAYGSDLLSDNAYFLLGNLYENELKNKKMAMDTFQELMKKYPESMYTNDARKKYRALRGDDLE